MRSQNKKVNNYLLLIEYNGSSYSGWQKQTGVKTIQSELEIALEPVFGRKISITPSGRTDAGVHALKQYCNFRSRVYMPPEKVTALLNGRLPKDISVQKTALIDDKFDCRFSAAAKAYEYFIWNSPARSVWKSNSWHIAKPLNLSKMKKSAKYLLGTHDFRAFEAPRSTQVSKISKIKNISLKRQGKLIKIEFIADRFLYKMVRNITGTLVEAGLGRLEPGSIQQILKSRKRTNAGPTAPACGLFLKEVYY
jgi:tRNA pseudouridine38-40 synthase